MNIYNLFLKMKMNGTAIRVLVADNEPLINWGISRFLKKSAVVNTVATAEEVLIEIGIKSYDLCILDYDLPEMTGFEVMKKINERFPETKVAIMSANNIDDVKMAQIDRNAYAFIEKPIDLSDLKDVVERATRALACHDSQ